MTERAQRDNSDRVENLERNSLVSQGFTGTVNLQLNDLIQMVCLSRSDLTIRVRSGEGSGAIHIRDGEIHHAQTDTLQGEPAFFEILRWSDGHFEMHLFQNVEVNSLNKPWEHLLLEAMRRRDEEAIEHNQAILEEFERDFSETAAPGELDDEIDQVFDELELAAREFRDEDEAEVTPSAELQQVIKVLVVDDSSFFSRQLKKMLEEDSNIEIVGTAKNGKEALDFLASRPAVDLITLDIQMPVMQGDTALKHIMIRHPIPVLIVSTFQTDSLGKIFEFLQVGAIDFISKPEAKENLALYGERLRDLAKKAARSHVGHFRRWRKNRGDSLCAPNASGPPSRKVLAIVGAEGAYMDWFRLPLSLLSRQGLVLGFQKLADPFLPKFCQLIEDGTKARTEQIPSSGPMIPGCFYMGNAGHRGGLKASQDAISLETEALSAESCLWQDGICHWLTQLAVQIRDRLSVYFLSGALSLPPHLIEHLVESGVRLILSPQDTVMCTELVDGLESYSLLYPQTVLRGGPESLMEVWLKDESYA